MRSFFYLSLAIYILLAAHSCLAAAAAGTGQAAPAQPGDSKSASQPNAVMPVTSPGQSEDTAMEEEKEEEEEELSVPVQDRAWQDIWSGQIKMVNEIRQTAINLSNNFSEQTANLSQHLQPFEEEARRLLVFANTFRGHPNAMEAVGRRMGATIAELDTVLSPVTMARAEAEAMLERINHMALNLPQTVDKNRLSPEMQAYINDITRTRIRLTAVLAQYDSMLPSLGLVTQLEKARKTISNQLPGLWKSFYLQKPISWMSPDSWTNATQYISYSWKAVLLRLPVEIPGNTTQWSTALFRFIIGLFFATALSLIVRRHVLTSDAPPAIVHIFKYGVRWLILGFAILGSAISSTGDFFRLFVVLGSVSLIIAQVLIAWDLRLLQLPDLKIPHSPFLQLLPLAFLGYLLLYMPFSQPLVLVIWAVLLIGVLYIRRGKQPPPGLPSFEAGTRECRLIIHWICLFLAMAGLPLYSIGLYIAYVALAVAFELSIGGMAVVGRINEHLPQQGARAAMLRLVVAMAAPFVLVLAVAGVCVWAAMLPGGTYLLSEYALKGVRIGATQFNIIQILLIISAFYLTRTIVSMGTHFLTRLPKQGSSFDTTLITPMQTFFTYAVWAVFGLFVLHALGMQLSNLAMVAGGLSVGIGFGMQTIVNNFLSGLILIFGRTLQVGDVIEVGNLTGRVRKISVRATMVETYDNAIIYVPNSEFMSGRLINWTSFSRSVRREVVVGVAYGSNTEKVIKLLIDVAAAHKNVLQYPKPSVHFIDFGASTLDFQLRFWVKDYDLGSSTMSDIRLGINKVFNEEHIDIAFPQLDVHIKDEQKENSETSEESTNPANQQGTKRRTLSRRPLKKGVLPPPQNLDTDKEA